jgi:peptide/nickel transport system permease protein
VNRVALAVLLLLVGVTLAAPWLAPHDPSRQYRDQANAPPGRDFPLGSDEYGRDIWSRLLHAGRWSMLAGATATALSLGCGTLLGLAASGAPRWLEAGIVWLADLTLTLPWLYLLFALRGMLPLSLPPEAALLAVIALVGCAGWATPARLVRATAQGVLAMDYVKASRAFGASRGHILLRHVVPALGPVLSAQLFVLLPQYILAESALSLLGLGLSEPTPTWGTMLGAIRHNLATGVPWWMLTPALPLIALTLASGALTERTNNNS